MLYCGSSIFKQVARLSGWSDSEAIALDELHMLDKAQSWFVGLDRAALNGFDALSKLMIDCFGDSKTTLMTRLDHRKQEANKSVRDYVDAMRPLFAKTRYPAEGQATKFTSGLNGKFKHRVQNMMPRNMDHAVEIAV